MGFTYFIISLTVSNYYLQQVQTKIHANVAQSIIEDHNLVNHGELDKQKVSSTFNRYMLLNPHLEIYLLDLQGNVLEYSADPKKIKRHKINIEPLLARINKTTNLSEQFSMGDDPRSVTGTKPFSVAYLPNAQHPEALLYVIIQNSIEQEANRQLQESILLELSAWSFLTSLIFGLLLSGIIFYKLTKRISELTQTVIQFKNEPKTAIEKPPKVADELNQLEMVFFEMSVQIQKQIQQLKNTDQQRRFMISSLSHDIRTPLTNMLGYMEQLQQTESSSYLRIAYQNGLKLKHYLDQLFEFSKLDMNTFQLQKQRLSLSEFSYDIFQEYQKTYPDRTWKTAIQTHIIYSFDANQLERAIRNLLDNAIKHGHGVITFSLKQNSNSVIIEICDQGEKLEFNPSQQLFDRYETSQTPSYKITKHHSGLGLGLAIVESIVKKHDGQFNYQREQNLNCFTISLPSQEVN